MSRSAAWLWLVAGGAAWGGAPPQISTLLPRGGQRGTDVVVTFGGARLDHPLEVLTDAPGISATGFEPVDAGNLRCTLRLAADAAPGLHRLRLRTVDGVSNLKLFSVSNLPESPEVEPNNTRAQAAALNLPVCISGAIPPEDVDVFAFHAGAGQTLAFEVEGLRLGDALFDPRVAILDAGGGELVVADDVPLLRQDAAIVHTFAAEGTYFVQVRETAYRGGGNFWYRLHAGSFPRPTACMPCALQTGTTGQVTWLGDATLSVQAVTVGATGWHALDAQRADGAVSPTPLPLRVCAHPVGMEAEPNNVTDNATSIAVPGGVWGVLYGERDVDCFVFDGAAGLSLEARVYARAIGSPVDSVLNVRKATGEGLGGADDSGGPDSRVRFTCGANEKVIVEVRDLLFRQGPDFTYFLEILPVKPALTLAVSSPEASLTIAAGNRAALLVTGTRADFGGALKISAPGLPAGVTVACEAMHESVGQLPLVFEATAETVPAGALVELVGETVDPALGVRGGLAQSIDLVKYENNPFYSVSVDRLAVAVARPAPLRVDVDPPPVPLVRMGSMVLPVRVQRAEGFSGPVTVRMLWNPPGIGSGTLELPPDKSEGALPLNAAGNAAVGVWKIALTATTDGGGAPIEVSTSLVPLQVAEPFVEFAVQKSRTEQGKGVEVLVKVTQRTPFDGEIQAQLLGLPGKVLAAPMPMTKDTGEIKYVLEVPPDAPPGEHNTLFVHADVPGSGGAVAHNSPAGQLIVDKPLPPKDPQQEAARQEAARKAQEEKDRKKAERLAAIEARRAEAKKQAPPPTEPKPQE
ncbi:MAG: PPC domain-containing protein [Phycisphaerales bacterium]|nr:PPC domain-containing protein [Phycisphaerales bacterium]